MIFLLFVIFILFLFNIFGLVNFLFGVVVYEGFIILVILNGLCMLVKK